jgi:hypothetical protein
MDKEIHMKQIFAVALLLMAFATTALADGGGKIPPAQSPQANSLLPDGGGQIPPI